MYVWDSEDSVNEEKQEKEDQKWARTWIKTKVARNWWEKAKPSWTPTPRFHGRDAKYASKHYETYGGSSTTNE